MQLNVVEFWPKCSFWQRGGDFPAQPLDRVGLFSPATNLASTQLQWLTTHTGWSWQTSRFDPNALWQRNHQQAHPACGLTCPKLQPALRRLRLQPGCSAVCRAVYAPVCSSGGAAYPLARPACTGHCTQPPPPSCCTLHIAAPHMVHTQLHTRLNNVEHLCNAQFTHWKGL